MIKANWEEEEVKKEGEEGRREIEDGDGVTGIRYKVRNQQKRSERRKKWKGDNKVFDGRREGNENIENLFFNNISFRLIKSLRRF